MGQGIHKFEVNLDCPCKKYRGGDNITGHVYLQTSKKVAVKEITLMVSGEGFTHCDLAANKNNREKYFTKTFVMHSNYDGVDNIFDGLYVFPFSVELPQTIPPTYEGRFGCVRYSAKATMKQPWKLDEHAVAEFVVENLLNLNDFSNLTTPIEMKLEKNLLSFLRKPGLLAVRLFLPMWGVVPGEELSFLLTVDNASKVCQNRVDVCLIKYESCKSEGHMKEMSTCLKKIILGQVEPYGVRSWSEALQVPSAFTPFNLSLSNVLNESFAITANVRPDGFHSNVEVSLPVVIGHIALRRVQNTGRPRRTFETSDLQSPPEEEDSHEPSAPEISPKWNVMPFETSQERVASCSSFC